MANQFNKFFRRLRRGLSHSNEDCVDRGCEAAPADHDEIPALSEAKCCESGTAVCANETIKKIRDLLEETNSIKLLCNKDVDLLRQNHSLIIFRRAFLIEVCLAALYLNWMTKDDKLDYSGFKVLNDIAELMISQHEKTEHSERFSALEATGEGPPDPLSEFKAKYTHLTTTDMSSLEEYVRVIHDDKWGTDDLNLIFTPNDVWDVGKVPEVDKVFAHIVSIRRKMKTANMDPMRQNLQKSIGRCPPHKKSDLKRAISMQNSLLTQYTEEECLKMFPLVDAEVLSEALHQPFNDGFASFETATAQVKAFLAPGGYSEEISLIQNNTFIGLVKKFAVVIVRTGLSVLLEKSVVELLALLNSVLNKMECDLEENFTPLYTTYADEMIRLSESKEPLHTIISNVYIRQHTDQHLFSTEGQVIFQMVLLQAISLNNNKLFSSCHPCCWDLPEDPAKLPKFWKDKLRMRKLSAKVRKEHAGDDRSFQN